MTRREFVALGSASAAVLGSVRQLSAARAHDFDVGIVGAGLSGLACADRLAWRGFVPTVYEASDRVGGRCRSLRGFFPGQVAERGGELIDNLHKTLLGYARAFGLTREDMTRQPGDVTYYFNGQHVPERAIVEELRAFVPAMRADLRRLSRAPVADSHNAADVELDHLSLAEYLETRGAGPWLKAAIEEAYVAEYGLEPDRQSSLNFLLFMHADRRSRFQPFGVFSDERFHIVEGNDQIPQGIAARLPRPVELGRWLLGVRRLADGRIELTFETDGGLLTRAHDAVVLTIPFTVLRDVELDDSLGIPAWKRQAIEHLGYGTNAKMMVGFTGRPWALLASTGASYSDLPHHQTTWETNPSRAASDRAILTDYSGGDRGLALDSSQVQLEATRFLSDLDLLYPGALTQATVTGSGEYLAHIEHWPSNPHVRGSYACYLPGQFTSIAGRESTPIDNLFFAGEHANSFYEWQGFMEGAALAGIAAAEAIRSRVRGRR